MIEIRMRDVDLRGAEKSRQKLNYFNTSALASYRAGIFLTKREESAQLTRQGD